MISQPFSARYSFIVREEQEETIKTLMLENKRHSEVYIQHASALALFLMDLSLVPAVSIITRNLQENYKQLSYQPL